MLRQLGFKLLTLGLVLPGAALALGLGDIHVESALHQPLAAEIDIVGATPESSAGLTATIPDEEVFRRYGLERPVVLSSSALTVRQNSEGRQVLVLRSTDAFTEPMVTLLVDLHSPTGELIREYTVLLDPAGLAPEHSATESAPALPPVAPTAGPKTPPVVTPPEHRATAQDPEPAPKTYIVAPHDTLDRVASIAGAHSRSDRRRMMIAIFRANPAAFQANLNILRSGATLHLPGREELSNISGDEANREFAAQMAAWRGSDHHLAPSVPAAIAEPVPPTPPLADAKPDTESHETQTSALTQRVESLEKSLDELKQNLKSPPVARATIPSVPVRAAAEPSPVSAPEQLQPDEDEPAPVTHHGMRYTLLVIAFVLTLAASAWIYRELRSNHGDSSEPYVKRDSSPRRNPDDIRTAETSETPPLFPKIDISASYLVEELKGDTDAARPSAGAPTGDPKPPKQSGSADSIAAATGEDTAKLPTPRVLDVGTTAVLALHVDPNADTAAREFAFFNPESAHNTTHVTLASGLEAAPPPFVERRKNPADVLRQAIEREPDRSDLRLKLLELYYTAAEQNRRAFMEAVRQLAKNEKLASAHDWSQISDMGRAIAPDDELFANGIDKKWVA